ncbi:hypothetical protein KKC97_08905, partial [bacterium]|nr:hypothetical protein [bacterium]
MMSRSKLIVLCLVFLVSLSSARTGSHSAFFVANEGQWPGEFAFRYDGGGGSWFVTKDGLTIDLKQYEVSPQTGFGGTEGGYSNHDPFRDREPEPRSVKGHVLKVNLIGAYAHHFAVAAHGSANEILDAPLPQTTVGVQNDRVVFSAEQGLSGSGSLPESFSAEPCVPARP